MNDEQILEHCERQIESRARMEGAFLRTCEIVGRVNDEIEKTDPRDAAAMIFLGRMLRLLYEFKPTLNPDCEKLTDDLPF